MVGLDELQDVQPVAISSTFMPAVEAIEQHRREQ